ncbi:hypothetical protein Hdeb2414_s0002g00064891 [Helianthus debilis subsp. tardiflorus]
MAGDMFIFTGANDDSYDVSLSFNYMQRNHSPSSSGGATRGDGRQSLAGVFCHHRIYYRRVDDRNNNHRSVD